MVRRTGPPSERRGVAIRLPSRCQRPPASNGAASALEIEEVGAVVALGIYPGMPDCYRRFQTVAESSCRKVRKRWRSSSADDRSVGASCTSAVNVLTSLIARKMG